MAKVRKRSNGCWHWVGARLKQKYDYGTFWIDGGSERAHCVAYAIFRGSIPRGLFVLHTCDVPRCVNPDHLFLGTQSDNMHDASTKGRMNVNRTRDGKPSTKLREMDIAEIIAMRVRGNSNVAIAQRFCVDPSTIGIVLRDRGYRRWTKKKR